MGNSDIEDKRKRSWAEETKECACAVGTSVSTHGRYVRKCPENDHFGFKRPCLNGRCTHRHGKYCYKKRP